MSEKIKLNKNTMRDQRLALKLYSDFLPTLELRKQQLQGELRRLNQTIAGARKDLEQRLAASAPWRGLLATTFDTVRQLIKVDQVLVDAGNVAGVRIPIFRKVQFADVAYSLLATSPAVDAAVSFWQMAVSLREQLGVLNKQRQLIERELTKTTQRINLYEKVLIPQTKENIRKIKVYLGDQQTAAVCRAKIAKAKLVAKQAIAVEPLAIAEGN